MITSRRILSSAVTLCVAAFGLSGCAPEPQPTPSTSSVVASLPTTATQAPLPDPVALTDVLVRLSDPNVPGNDKLPLVQGATESDAAAIDRFAKALADNHLLPLTFGATDLIWSETEPGAARASVTVTPAKPETAPFTFPMEFVPAQGGWQLSRQTADLLLAFGEQHTAPDAEPAPPEPPR